MQYIENGMGVKSASEDIKAEFIFIFKRNNMSLLTLKNKKYSERSSVKNIMLN